ncbi:MAG: cysteine desulfurase [Parcubacteria group bacterium]|nr:cysteine desulfurase [Parcubacteria group bacterium]
MKEIYLDNAATTPCDPRVLKAMEPFWSKIYGNPLSFNDAGRTAKKAMDKARKKIARLLGAKDREIIFTSSATEANNLAIQGIARNFQFSIYNLQSNLKIKNIKPHIITTKVEHHSVIEPVKQFEKNGFEVTYLKVNKEGLINLNDLKKSLRRETILVSIIYAGNEIGSIQPLKKIAKIIKEFKKVNSKQLTVNSCPYFHADASQAAAYLDMNVNNLGVDLLTASSSKIYGPKGVAALYVRQGTEIEPLIFGGGQEFGLRAATPAVPLIVGFAKALEIANSKKRIANIKLEKLRKYFIGKLKKVLPAVKINGPDNHFERVPGIINMTFPGIENEQLLLYLDKYGIRASAGSACASHEMEPSHVLIAFGLSNQEARSSIRFSLGKQTTKADLDYVLKILPKVVKSIEGLYPKNLKKHYYGRID